MTRNNVFWISISILFSYCSSFTTIASSYEQQLDSIAAFVVSEPEKVIEMAEKIIHEHTNNIQPAQTGRAHYYLGAAYNQLNEPDHAIYHFSKGVDVFKEIENDKWLGKTYINLGIVHRDHSNHDRSIKYLEEAGRIFHTSKLVEKQIEVMLIKGSVYAKQHKFNEAIAELNEAAMLSETTGNDSLKARSYTHLTLVYRERGSFINALESERKAGELFMKMQDSVALAASYNMQGSIFWRMHKFPEAEKAYLKAVEIRKSLYQSLYQARSLENLARVYKDWQYVNKADSITHLAIALYKKNDDSPGVASSYNNLGNIYFEQNNLVKALHCYLKALETYENVNHTNGIITIQKNIGNIYKAIGEYEKAMDYYRIAHEKELSEKNLSGAAYIENLIGNCYLHLEQYEEALEYYNKALRKYEKLSHEKNMALTLNLVGNVYYKQRKFAKALKQYEFSSLHATNVGDLWRVATEWNNIGNVYLEKSQYNKAMDAFQMGYHLNKKIKNVYGTALCSRKIGEIYYRTNRPDSALLYLSESFELGRRIENKELIKNASYNLYIYYNEQEDYKHALMHYRTFARVSDSIDQETNSQHIAEIQLSQKILEKEDLINEYLSDREMLLADNELKDIQLVKQKAVQYILIIAVVAALIILFLLFNRYRLKRRHTNELDKQIKIIKDTNNALADSEAQLLTLNATKDKFFSVLAHDLRNPLTGIVTASNTLQNNYHSFGDEQRTGFIEIINSSARQLENLLNNLLFWTKSQTGRNSYHPLKLNLQNLVEEVIQLSKINADRKQIKLIHHLCGNEYIFADKEMITTVLRNLVSNAIKFTRTEGVVVISATLEEGNYVISVTDTGIGISPGNLRKLFNFEHKISTYGTEDEAGSGLGLILSKEFVEKNQGKIWVDRTSKKGTTLKFTVPKNKETMHYDQQEANV